ncbi:TatD family hydrolase [Candidatus Peribacteria bacterium]|nr:TatD family hydrolase [Candidatus Peribacteria bacterium]
MLPLIDTHAHYYFRDFDADRERALARDSAAGVLASVQIGCDEVSSLAAIRLAQQHPGMYTTVGLHPCDALQVGRQPRQYAGMEDYVPRGRDWDSLFTVFRELIERHPGTVVGVGECGFDRYHDASEALYTAQYESFRRHLALSREYELPLVIHSRASTPELEAFMKEYMRGQGDRFVVHCFSEGAAFARSVTAEPGGYIGIGGVATYQNAAAVREAIIAAPLERILTETDAPFLVPAAYKKTHKRCESAMMDTVVELIAALKQVPLEDCAAQLVTNAQRFYGINE